jgi:hypothetical protein
MTLALGHVGGEGDFFLNVCAKDMMESCKFSHMSLLQPGDYEMCQKAMQVSHGALIIYSYSIRCFLLFRHKDAKRIKQYYINNMKKASLDAKWLDVRGVSTRPR